MSTGWVGLPEEKMGYADCGSAGLGYSFRYLEANVNPVLAREGSNVTLTIHSRFRADRWEGGLVQRTVEEDRACYSTGLLEEEIRNAV